MAARPAVEEIDEQADRGPDQEEDDALVIEVEEEIDAARDRDRRGDEDRRRPDGAMASGIGPADPQPRDPPRGNGEPRTRVGDVRALLNGEQGGEPRTRDAGEERDERRAMPVRMATRKGMQRPSI